MRQVAMTPIKSLANKEHRMADLMPGNSVGISSNNPLAHSSVDEDYQDIEYRLNSERDDFDNITLKNSLYNHKESIIS